MPLKKKADGREEQMLRPLARDQVQRYRDTGEEETTKKKRVDKRHGAGQSLP